MCERHSDHRAVGECALFRLNSLWGGAPSRPHRDRRTSFGGPGAPSARPMIAAGTALGGAMRADADGEASGLAATGSGNGTHGPADAGQGDPASRQWQQHGGTSMRLAEIMTKAPVTARDGDAVDEVAARMIRHRIGCLPVVDAEGQLVGIVTAANFGVKEDSCPFPPFCASRFPGEQAGELAPQAPQAASEHLRPHTRTAEDIMTPQPIAFTEDAAVVEAVAKMLHLGLGHVPVVRHGVPVGVVAREDILRLALRLLSGPWPREVRHESPSAIAPSPAEGAGEGAALDWST
jgi:CBS domain-containing protein